MKKIYFIVFIFILFFSFSNESRAQSDRGLMLSITPPLIKNNVNPGQIWKSYIKLVNNNKTDIKIYVEVMDFKGGTENGTVEFIKSISKNEEENKHLLSRWIVIDPGPIEIPAQNSKEIPFIIDVPEDANPGGHYAAILAGTRPPDDQIEGTSIKVSSLLGSLMLLNVKGEVTEEGKIREFSVPNIVFQKAEVDFTVRFENTGNTHIQPQGEIRVYDWLGKDRGYMTLNHNSEFGNVLPEGIRKWNFNWKGEDSIFSMGRYRAALILGYGEENGRQTDTREMYFWVLDYKILGIILGSIILVLILISVVIRFYVRRAIKRTQDQLEMISSEFDRAKKAIPRIPQKKRVVDLKKETKDSQSIKAKVKSKKRRSFWGSFIRLIAFILFILIVVGSVILYLEFSSWGSTLPDKEKQVEQKEETSAEIPDISEIEEKKNQEVVEAKEEEPKKEEKILNKKDAKLVILNGSGQAGVAGKASEVLEANEYFVAKLGNAQNFDYEVTELIYKEEFVEFVKEIKTLLDVGAKMEVNEFLEEDVLLILGKDYK